MEGSQEARDNAIQIQVETINVGCTEESVRSIISTEKEKILKEAELVATEVAQKRLNEYTEVLIRKLVKYEMLQAFSDPSIQMLFRKTEKTAICTDRPFDYEMLSELLAHRVRKDKDYVIRAAVNKSVEIIEDISEEALLGVTLMFAIISLQPESGIILEGLALLDSLFGRLIGKNELPCGQYWVDNLELVQVIKIIPFSRCSKFNDYFLNKMEGYFIDGLEFNSEKYNEVIKELNSVGLSEKVLVKNELLDNYYRIPVVTKDVIKELILNQVLPSGEIIAVKLTPVQVKLLEEIYDKYDRKHQNINDIKKKYEEILSDYPNLKRIANWWDQNMFDKPSIGITSIGKILTQVNAKRLDDRVPNIDINTY